MSTARKAMAAQFTELTLDEMESFLKRAFRVLRPKKQAIRGEIVFDLAVGPTTVIRVWTSVPQFGTTGAGHGADAIRIQLYSMAKNRPLVPGKAPIVKRTQGWRDNLKDRIEDYMELYDSKEEAIEAGQFIDWKA